MFLSINTLYLLIASPLKFQFASPLLPKKLIWFLLIFSFCAFASLPFSRLLAYQMGVAVLHPQDCLRNPSSRQHIISPPPKMKIPNPNPKATRNSRGHPNRPKRSQNGSHPTRPAPTSDLKPQVNKPVMGQVKILKRGEQLTGVAADRQSATVEKELREKRAEPFVPMPELVPTEKVAGLYAGSSMFVASPPPSSVPLPAFFTKKTAAVSDATSDLRRILRLDLS